MDPFWFRRIITDPHIHPHVNIVPGRQVPKIKNLYLRTDFRYLGIYNSNISNNELHSLTLIKLTVTCFLGTVGFLITYSSGDIKYVPNYRRYTVSFNKTLFF
jgi:hypothetical protein